MIRRFVLACAFGVVAISSNAHAEQSCTAIAFLDREPYIHPAILEDMSTWTSDTGDQVLAINITDSQESNRYCCGRIEHASTGVISYLKDDGSWFGYRHIGSAGDGVEAVRIFDNTGGSGTFNSVLFVRIGCSRGLAADGQKVAFTQPRYVVHKLGQFVLGDRWDGDVEVTPGQIVLNGVPLKIDLSN